MSAATMDRATRRAAQRASRRSKYPATDQLMLWADIAEAEAREQGRALPYSGIHPDEVSYERFHGMMNSLGRKPAMVRLLACLGDARDALEQGDLHGAERALRMCCTLMPRDEDEGVDAFHLEAGDDGFDPLEYGLRVVHDRDAPRALGLISTE